MEFFVENVNLALFLPLIMCFIIGFNAILSNKIDKQTLFLISIVSASMCAVFCLCSFLKMFLTDAVPIATGFNWFSSDKISFFLGTLIDRISVVGLLVASICSLIIQILSYSKLKDLYNFPKLLFYINMFSFALTGIFISPNLFQTYLFCEVVGVASYLLINFDFSNREESKAAIKSFIFNRVGDLTLLFCVITVLYYSVVYNDILDYSALSYASFSNIANSINSLMTLPVFVVFCSLLIFVIVMKFMQAFIYLTFEQKENSSLSGIILFQNSLITLIGVYLFIRVLPLISLLNTKWWWTIPVVLLMFFFIGVVNNTFKPFCKLMGWIEKYIIESVVSFVELVIRAISFVCCKFQAGNFQTYIIYSLFGLVMIFGFVLAFYLVLIKM